MSGSRKVAIVNGIVISLGFNVVFYVFLALERFTHLRDVHSPQSENWPEHPGLKVDFLLRYLCVQIREIQI